MKKILYILAFTVSLCSCSGILDTYPHNQISAGNMWSTASMSQAGMDGLMYPFMRQDLSSLNDMIKSNGTGGINRFGVEGMGYTSIIDWSITYLKDATKRASNVENSAEWMQLFTAVHACNRAIKYLSPDIVGSDLYEQYICEARMIRAFSYSRLNMVFGEVPIYLEEVDNSECNRTQDSWDDVWNMIIKECSECIANPYFQTNNFTGVRLYKPSKGMAYALRGNAYMWLAANKNPVIYPGHKGISEDKVKEYYKLAAADFAKVKECGFDLWKAGEWNELFLPENEHNCEMIFPLEFSTTSGYESLLNWAIGSRTNLNSWNRLVASSEFVDDFEWKDGSKFDWTQIFPDWNNMERYQREVFFLRDSLNSYRDSIKLKGEQNCVERTVTLFQQRQLVVSRIAESSSYADSLKAEEFLDKYYLNIGNEARLRTAYDDRDPRLDMAVITPYKPYRHFNDNMSAPMNFVQRWPRYKRQDQVENSDIWMELSANMVYGWYKYLVTDGSIIIRYDGTDWPLLRYTQIQLLWAEAALKSGDPDTAVRLVNEIRNRAGMPDVTSTDLMDEIMYENRVELCLEGKDYFNEIRWSTSDRNVYKETKFQGEDFWDPQSCWGAGGWKTGYYYTDGMWPLSAPLTEIVRNSNLKRRPFGWTY